MRDLFLLTLGSGARVGAIAELKKSQIHLDLEVINLLENGEIEKNKRRPIVPITGPMHEILKRLIEEAPKARKIHF